MTSTRHAGQRLPVKQGTLGSLQDCLYMSIQGNGGAVKKTEQRTTVFFKPLYPKSSRKNHCTFHSCVVLLSRPSRLFFFQEEKDDGRTKGHRSHHRFCSFKCPSAYKALTQDNPPLWFLSGRSRRESTASVLSEGGSGTRPKREAATFVCVPLTRKTMKYCHPPVVGVF